MARAAERAVGSSTYSATPWLVPGRRYYDLRGLAPGSSWLTSRPQNARPRARARGHARVGNIDEDEAGNAADQLALAGHQVRALPCDVADENDVANLVAQTVTAFGRLDAAYNNAGSE